METPASLLAFWFGDLADDVLTATRQSDLWWSKRPHIDQLIHARFAATLHKLEQNELDSWGATATGTLALILLSDQFPRNMYRGTARAFAYDERARAWCRQGLARQLHVELRRIEQVFFYLPLEHSEDLADQDLAVSLFSSLLAHAEPAQRPTFEQFLDFAQRHRDIIREFGRFPHRNALLGRVSTQAEEIFLEQEGTSF